MPIKVNAAKTEVTQPHVNAAKTEDDFVKVNAAKSISFQKVVTPPTDVFPLNDWTAAYYNDGATLIPTSGQGSTFVYGDKALRYGRKFNGDTKEKSMMTFSVADKAALDAYIASRPTITLMEFLFNTQHTQNGQNFPTIWLGWHGTAAKPSSFQRLHTEQQAGWGASIAIPHNTTNDGDEIVRTIPDASGLYANLSAQILAGNIYGMTLSWEAASNGDDWGWLSGTEYNTDESSGTAGGTWITTIGHAKAPQLRITAN